MKFEKGKIEWVWEGDLKKDFLKVFKKKKEGF